MIETSVIAAGEPGPKYDGVMVTQGDGPGMIRLSRTKANGGHDFTSAVMLDEPARLALIATLLTPDEVMQIAVGMTRFGLALADALQTRVTVEVA